MPEHHAPDHPRPEQTFFDDPAIDRLMGVVMALATEVYVLRDRVHAMERQLAENGALDAERLGAEPSDEERFQAAADRDAFVRHLLQNLTGQQQAKGPLR